MTTLAGIKIRSYRDDQALTRADFGTLVGVAPETVAGWEVHGKRARPEAAARLVRRGIVEFGDWYQPGMCGRCERRADDPAVLRCTAVDCMLQKKLVG